MTFPELLKTFDRQERMQVRFPGMTRQSFPELVRFVRPGPGTNFILYSHLKPETADDTIRAQVEDLKPVGGKIDWKVYSHDRPADLDERLELQGFVSDEPAPTLCLEIAEPPPSLVSPSAVDVRRLSDPSQLDQVAAIEAEVWEEDFGWVMERFSLEMRAPGFLEMFVAYVDDRPASTGWVHFQEGSQFASLWGGATIPSERGKGLYTAILAARMKAAMSRGRRYLTVEAEPASERILVRHGFRELAMTRTFTWTL